VSAALAFPAIIGFAVLAPEAMPVIYGDRWAESAKIAQVLGLVALPFTLNRFAGPARAALGRSGTLARIAALQLTLTVALSVMAAPFGLTAIAVAYVLRAYLTLPVQMRAFKRYSGLGYGAVLGAIAPALSMTLVMAGALLALDQIAGARIHNRAVYLLAMIAAGAGVYAGSMLLFARRFVLEQIRDLKALLPGAAGKLSRASARSSCAGWRSATAARGFFSRDHVARVLRRRPGVPYSSMQIYRIWSLLLAEIWARTFLDCRGAPLASA
jgi:hypothetical protein